MPPMPAPAKVQWASTATASTLPLTNPAPPLLLDALGSRYSGASELYGALVTLLQVAGAAGRDA